MADLVLLYISAASDLEREREILGRAVAEIPVTLGWRILQSPTRGEPPDLEAVARADVHLLLLGGDIRSPVGLEWAAARRAGRSPVLFLKQDILRTLAAQEFLRFLEKYSTWRPFKSSADLRIQALKTLASHILDRSSYYALKPEEYERLQNWRDELESSGETLVEERRGGTGESGLIISVERYVPSEGVLIQPPEDKDEK